MRKGLPKNIKQIPFLFFKRVLLFLGLAVFSVHMTSGQNTVCAKGYLTGKEVLDAMGLPGGGGVRSGGTFVVTSTVPDGGQSTITIDDGSTSTNEDDIFTGFDSFYTSYTIQYNNTPKSNSITYFVSGTAPAVTLSTPDPSTICEGEQVDINFTLSGATGDWEVQLEDGTSTITYTVNAVSGSPNTVTYTLDSDATIEITSVEANGGGCAMDPADLPSPISFTVLPDPSSKTVTGTSVCDPASLNDITLFNSDSGVEYYIVYNDGSTTSEVSGTRWTGDGGDHIFTGINEGPGEYYVVALGCHGEEKMGGSFYISTPPATTPTISSSSPACPGSDLTIDNTEGSDVQYYLLRNGVRTGAYRNGNNGTITFGNLTTPGTYTIEAERHDCVVTIPGSLEIQALPAFFELSANKFSYCAGTVPTGVELTLDGSESGIQYQLQRDLGSGYTDVGSPVTGDGGPLTWVNVTEGTYRVVASTTAGCSIIMNGRPTIEEATPPSAVITTSTPNSRCEGASVDFNINVTLTGTQPFSFEITNNAGDPPIVVNDLYSNTYTISVDPSTDVTYTLTNLTDASGCDPVMDVGRVQFYVRPNPVFTFDASPNPVSTVSGNSTTSVCVGSEVTLDVNVSNTSGPFDYVWSNSLGTTKSVSFNPNETRTYSVTVENEYGCVATKEIEVVVNPLPTIDFEPDGGDYDICINGGTVELIPASPNTGGNFTGTGVTGNFFDPITAGVGRHDVTYTFTNTTTGCENSITKPLDVNPEPNVNIHINQTDYCYGDGSTTLNSIPQNSNGSWEIVGGTRSWFRDNGDGTATLEVDNAIDLTGGGTFDLVYHYTDPNTGCIGEDMLTVDLHPDLADEIDFEYRSSAAATYSWKAFPAGDLLFCQSNDPIDLRGIFDDTGLPIGDGSFSGPGVTNTGAGTAQFDPSVAGNGNHTITYTYTDPSTTCTGVVTHSIQIGTTLEFPGLNALYCASDGPINVYGDEVPSTGVSGTLEIFNNNNPASPSLLYTHSSNSSSNPFSFDPSTEGLGPGDYLFRFTYNDGVCDNVIEQEVTVADVVDATFTIDAPSTQFCETQSPVQLIPSQPGGIFTINTSSGLGVSGYYFNPSHPDVVPGKTYTITYTINTGSCSDSYSIDVNVIPVPTLDISGLSDEYCDNDAGPFLIEPNNGGIAGAVYTFSATLNAVGRSPLYFNDGADTTHVTSYTYTGTSGDPLYFDPVQVGYGTYTITYTFDNTANTGCVTSVSKVVTVHETPGVTFAGMTDPVEYCQSDAPVTLEGSFVSGGLTGLGNFFGAGINNLTSDDGVAEFDPSSVIPGDHPIQYVYTDPATGCNSERTKIFTVKETPAVYNITPNSSTSAYPGHFCPGDNVVIGVDDSQDGVDYLLIRNGDVSSPVETIPGNASAGAITFPPVTVPGDYTVLAIWPSPSGCSQWMNGTVEVRENNVTASFTKQNVSCTGDTNGEIVVTASGGSGPYRFFLYQNASLSTLVDDNNSGIFTGLGAHVYYVQVEDAIGCTLPVPVEVNISEPASGLSVVTGSSPTGCAGCTAGVDCEGEAWVTISDGTAFADLVTYPSGYDVQWTDASGSTVTPSGDGTIIEKMPAGFYTVRVTDANGCWIEETIEIETVPAISLTEISRTHVDCHGAASGQFVVEATGGDPSAEYQFSIDRVNWLSPDAPGGSQRTFSALTAGSYNVYVRDAHYPRCEYQLASAIVLSEPSELTISEVPGSHIDVDCYGNATGQFEVVASGGSGTFEYSLNGGAFDSDKIFSGLVAGSYSVTVRDGNGCTASLASPVEITQPSQLTISNTSTSPVSCLAGNDGSISITASGGDGNYVYSIVSGPETRPDQTSNTFDNLPAGTYEVRVTDGSGCVAMYSGIVVTEPASALSLSGTVIQNVLCRGGNSGSLAVTASGGSGNYEFSIDGGTTWVTNHTNDYTFDNLVAGTYTIDVRDINGCTANTSVTITQPATAFSLSAIVDNHVTCFDGNDAEITATASGGLSSSGVNYVLYKDVAGSWVAQASHSNITGAPYTFTSLSAGDYRIEAWDNSGSLNSDYCFDFVEVTVNQPTAEIEINPINIHHVTTTGGSDGSIEIEITGGSGSFVSIVWSGIEEGTGNPVTGLANNVYVQPNLVAGTYSVEVTDDLGCTVVSDPIVVTDPDSPLGLSISTSAPGPCFGATNGTINLTAVGGVTPYASITLSRAGVLIPPAASGADNATFNNLGEGTYLAEVVDNVGTSYTETIIFDLPDQLDLNFSIIHDATCVGAADGTITFSVSGGTPDASVSPNTYDYFIIPPGGGVISGTVNAGSAETVASLTAGTGYRLMVIDDLGCNVETSFDIDEPDPITFDIDSKNLSCFGSDDGEITVTNVTGGWGSNYSYAWEVFNGSGWDPYPSSGPATTPTVNNLPVGTYRVTVTGNLYGCTATSSEIVITQPEELELILSGQKDITTCYGDNSGEVTLRVEGGTGPYDLTGSATYLNWSGSGTFVVSGLSAGVNSFNVQDANGCTASASATINEPGQLVVDNIAAQIECESDGSGGELEIEVSGGLQNATSEYAYRIELINQDTGNSLVWMRTSSAQPYVINDITGIPAGNYDLIISDANSSDPSACSYSDVVSLSYIDIQAVVTDVSCSGAADGAIDITIEGGSGNYAYQWIKDGGPGVYAITQDLSGLTSGNYTLTLTDLDRGGCSLVRNYQVNNGKVLYLDASVVQVSCNGGANGAIIVDDVVGAVPPVTYYLDGVADVDNDGQWTGLTAGTYMVTAIDADGCEVTESFYVAQPLGIDFTLSTSLDCSSDYSRSITLSGLTGGTAPYTFSWSGPGGFTQVSDTEITDITVGGTYSVTVTDHRNCSITKSITLYGKPVLSADVSAVQCNGGSNGIIDLTVTGGSDNFSYSWDDPATSTSQDLSGLAAGTYHVVVTDLSQICSVSGNPYSTTLEVEVSEPDPFVIDSYISHIDCGGGTPDGEINITSITGGSGSYTLTWDASPYITQGAWHQTGLPGGEYTVVISDADGCSVTRSFTVNEPDPLDFALDVDPSNCLQENSISIVSPTGGTGSYEFIWAGPGVDTSSPTITTQTNLPGGEYTVTMVDVGNAHNCNISKSVTLSKPLAVTYSVESETCPGANNGSVDITVSGGVAPYSYSWSTVDGSGLSVSEEDQSGLSAGTYQVIVTDSNPDGPCTFTISDITVNVANTISVGSNITHVRCFGAATGAISVNVTGGSGTYHYLWSGPDGFSSNDANITGLKAGSYTLVVSDVIAGTSCSVTRTFVVEEPTSAIEVTDVTVGGVDCRGNATGSIDITVAGGTAPYSFQWTGPASIPDPTLEDLSNVRSGVYNVVITDANGCVLDYAATYGSTINIPQPAEALEVVLVNVDDVTSTGGNDGAIEVDVTGGTGSYTILWFDDLGSPVPGTDGLEVVENLTAGTYRVYVEDENGCSDEILNIVVSEPNAVLDLKISKRSIGVCSGSANGQIKVDMTGGTLPYQSITLYNGAGTVAQVTNQNNAVFDNLPAGDYEVSGIDAKGVEVRKAVTLLEPTALQLNAAVTQHVECYSDATGIIEVSVDGGVAKEIGGNYYVTLSGGPSGTAANYSPLSGEVFTFSNLPAGTYTVRLIDDSNVNEVNYDNDSFADGYGDGTFNINTDCYIEQQLVVEQPEAQLVLSTMTGSEELCEGELPWLQIVTSNWDPAASPLEVQLSDGETYLVNSSPFQFQPNNIPSVGITQYTITGFVQQGTTCNKGTASGTATVEVHPLPTATIFGDGELCLGESRDLGIELTGTAPWNVTISDGTNTWNETYTTTLNFFTVSPVENSSYQVLSVSDAYCSNTGTGTANITVHELPTVTLTGNAEICEGESTDLTFDFTAGTGPWTVTFTENGVSRTVGPITTSLYTLSVTPVVTTDYELVSVQDANGCSQPASGLVRVTVREYPDQPTAIVGDDIVCQGSTHAYSVDPVPNATSYVWSLPTGATIISGDGTREIEVQFSTTAQTGNISVYAENSCGAGPNITLQINVDELPQSIGPISGPEDLCQGTTGISYSVTPVTDASTYNWTVPTGFTIVSGQGTAKIIVDLDPALNSTVGDITVTPENYCGVSSSTSTLEVEVHPLPQADAGTDQQLCGNSTTMNAADPSVIDPNWQGTWELVSGYADIVSPHDPNTVVNNISRGDVVLRWTVTNMATGGNGCSISDEVTLRNNTITVIADAEQTLTCDASSNLYGTPIPAYDNTSGRWSVESGSGVFDDATSASTTVYDLAPGSNILRWTITQNGCENYAEIEIINDEPDQAVIYAEDLIDVCGTDTMLLANEPVEGGGVWSVEKGRATITPIGGNSFEVRITNLARGENVIRWTITKNGHCSTFDEVVIRNNQLDVDAGDDFTTCDNTVQLMATEPPTGAVGYWTALDAAAGSATFSDGTSYQAVVSGLVNGENRLRWTLYKNGCESSDEIVITSNTPTQASVGSQQRICKNDTILSGNDPAPYEVGRWSVVQGSGEFVDENDPKTRVKNVGLGTNIYRWTIYNGNCSTSADLIVVNQQVEAFAGRDTVSCSRFVYLKADPVPDGYSGLWTIVSGSGGAVFDGDASNPNVGVQLSKGENILRWNVVHNQSGCSSSDEVSILVNAVDNVDAGGDQIISDGSGQAIMQAELPDRATGEWSIISGGGDIVDPSDPNTLITNLVRGPNIFRWTVTIGNCSAYDEVQITNGDVIEAETGPDIYICSDETYMNANDPDNAIGKWTLGRFGSGKFENERDPKTRVYDIGPGENEFVWTISYGQGTSFSSDTIIVINNSPDEARAGLDDYTCSDTYTLLGNTPDPDMGTVSWTIVSGSGTLVTPDQPETQVVGLSQGENKFVYTIEKGSGVNVCYSTDTVTIINGTATQAYAGEDQTICTDSVKLEPNVPNHGTGEWRILEGAAEFEDNMARKIARGTNRFMWVVSTEYCSSYDTVTIVNNMPSIPNAGRDIAVCVDSVTLSGSLDVYHTGEWSLISGSGTIEDPTKPDTKVTNLGQGENKFRWTITNGNCSDFDDVIIRNDFKEAVIRYDASTPLCVDTTVLEANNPLPGVGTWGVIGGSGSAEFVDPEDPYTVVRNLQQGENLLTWTITNGECTDVDTVRIINNQPTTADAGDNMATCDNFIYLTANNPVVGTGSWTIRNGGGNFSSLSDPSARVDSLKFGANIFRWTIEHEGCKSFDDVQIDYNTIQATVGDDRTICSDSEILQGNNPSPGTGTWTVVGGTSQAYFDDINNPNTTVRDLRKGTNRLRWTINYKGCETYAEVSITNALPSTAYAGNTQRLCDDETVLDAIEPEIGTGRWEVVAGSATIAGSDINNPKATVTGLAKGDNVLRWVVENGICSTSDEVLIVNNLPSTPFAGSDIEVCEPNHDLRAATPEYGEGLWSIIEGGGNISDVTDPRASISNLVPGITRLKWTVSMGQCSVSDTLVIENNTPTQANAGPDVSDCKDWAQLDANPAVYGTGEWYIVSGTGTFQNPADEATIIEDLGFGENILMWEIWNGSKCFSRDTVKIFNKVPEQSDAGNDKTICENYTTLNGNTPPSPAIGTWTVVSGAGTFDDPNSPSSIVRDIGFGDNVFKWTISYDECETESTVTIRSNKTDAYAGEDVVVYDPEVLLNANNVGELDAHWEIVGGTGEFEDPTFFNTLVTGLSEGINTFRWIITVDECDSYDDVSVEYRPTPDAGFITDVDSGCWPLTVHFTNYSVGVQERNYHWDFGDGNSSGDQNPVHTFEYAGNFPVVLTVPGPDGTEGYYQKIIKVYDHPEAAFSVTPEQVYVPGDEVRFFDLSVGAVDYLWDFGDGNTSTEAHPVHEYAETGVYDVTLHVTNEYNCTDSITIEGAVTAIANGFIKFPNAFKPRPDGGSENRPNETNNIFKPVYRDVDTYHLQIFNRWGQLIFESRDIEEGWNGFYQGQLAPQAVYVWKVSGTFMNGKEFRETGTVLLVR